MNRGILLAAALLLAAAPLLPLRCAATPGSAAAAANHSAAHDSVARIEVVYADWLDAVGAVSTIDSGLTLRVAGKSRSLWAARLKQLTPKLERALKPPDPAAVSSEDARALQVMRKGMVDYSPPAGRARSPA